LLPKIRENIFRSNIM